MSSSRSSILVALAGAFAWASPLHAGPPWVSVEYPANPHDPATRDALAVVHTYHHGDAIGFRVTARAVGMIRGARTTRALQVVPTSRTGVYAVRGELPDADSWVLVVETGEGKNGEGNQATALVSLGSSGDLLGVRVPFEVREGYWRVPRAVTGAEVDALLRTAVAMSAAGSAAAARAEGTGEAGRTRPLGAHLPGLPVGAALLVLLPSGAVLLSRRRR